MAVDKGRSVLDVNAIMGTYAGSTGIGAHECEWRPAGVRTLIGRAKALARTCRAKGGPPAGFAVGLDHRAPERTRPGSYVRTGNERRLELRERRDRAMVTEDMQTGWP